MKYPPDRFTNQLGRNTQSSMPEKVLFQELLPGRP